MNKNLPPAPPKWAETFLRWFCRRDLLEHIQGDLEETFEQNLQDFSPEKAKRIYSREVLGLFRPGIIRKYHLNQSLAMNISMFANYFKIAFRQIRRHKLFSGLNIFGLATSMSICLLIIMMLADQFSFDQFHTHKDDMYRVLSMYVEKGQTIDRMTATTALRLADELTTSYPFVKKATRMLATTKDATGGEKTLPIRGKWVDPEFLEMFSFDWVKGDKKTALQNPESIILTEETAYKFFENKDPLGEVISFDKWGEFMVTGVMADIPRQSHLQFDFLFPISARASLEKEKIVGEILNDEEMIWAGYVYVLLEETASQKDLNKALANIASTQTDLHKSLYFHYESEPFTHIAPMDFDIMNQEGGTIPIQLLYFLMALGAVIMVSACFNYTNLSIARSLKRAREIGIRKVVGAKRRQIIAQFLTESVLISWLALFLAVGLLELLIWAFYQSETFLHQFIHLSKTPQIYLTFWGFSTVVGIIAGLLPALHLSAFQPIQVLQKLSNIKLFSHVGMRKALIVIQFSFSIIFVMGTLILVLQQRHLSSIDLGIRTENIVNVSLQGMDYNLFVQEASKIKGIDAIAGSQLIPASGTMNSREAWISGKLDTTVISTNLVSANYIKNLELDLVAGQDFPPENIAGQEKWAIISEKAVKGLGFSSPDSILGHELHHSKEDTVLSLTVIGVIKDFHHMGVAEKPTPYMLRLNTEEIRVASVLVQEGTMMSTIEALKSSWEELDPVHEFSWQFFDEKVGQRFKVFTLGARIVGLIGFLAVVIACLGMLGMAVYEVEGKTKEIGIRKVLGAGEGQLIWKLSRNFLFLIGIAILIGLPVSYLGADMFLQQFDYRITFGVGLILLGITLILIPSLFSIISQTYNAAKANPVESLRVE